jgi:hypothetical protein
MHFDQAARRATMKVGGGVREAEEGHLRVSVEAGSAAATEARAGSFRHDICSGTLIGAALPDGDFAGSGFLVAGSVVAGSFP